MKVAVLLVLSFCVSFISLSQTYDDCISYVKDNKYKEAIEGLEKLRASGTYKSEASLLLCLIKEDRQDYVSAFDNFEIFYKNSENPYPYIYALSGSGALSMFKNSHGDEVQEFLEKVASDSKADNATKLLVTCFLGDFRAKSNDFPGMRKLYEDMGTVKNWSTVGVFDNASGSGFDKDFGVLAHPEKDYTFLNKNGAEVKWFNIVQVRSNDWMDFLYKYNIENSNIYTQTFITSDEDKEVIMKIGMSGSLKVWMNDFLVGKEKEERNTGPDVYSFQVKLQKGVNRLLIQTGSSEIAANGFRVRFFDLNDKLISNINSSSDYVQYTKAQPYLVKENEFFAEQYFENLLGKNKDNILYKILLADIYSKNGEKFHLHKILSELQNEAPHCTIISEMAITIARADKNALAVSKEIESIKINDPESMSALIYKYDDAINKERWTDAIDIINHMVQLYGESEATEIKLITALSKKRDNEKVIEEVNKAYIKYPNSLDIAICKYALIMGGSKNIKAANDILIAFAKSHYYINIIEQIIENDFKTGDKEGGKKLYREMISNYPFDYDLYSKYAYALYNMHDYGEAIDMIDQSIAIFPHNGSLYYTKGLILNAMARKADAIDVIKKAIVYSPTNFQARRKLSELENKKDIADYFTNNNINELYKNGRDNKDYDKEDAVCLLNEKRKIIYPEHGAVVEQNEMLYLIKSQSAIDHFKEYSIPYNSNVQRLIINKVDVLKKDGSIVHAERQKEHCVFPSLEVGDAIYLYYTLEDSYAGKLAEHFWDNFYFNSLLPVKTARFSLILPKDKKFNYKAINCQVQPVEKDIDDYKMYVWESNDEPKVVPETAMTSNILRQIVVSSIPDWKYVADWYNDISSGKIEADFVVKEKVKELMAGNEHKTDIEKANIIYDYIEDNCHYSNVPFLHSAYTPQQASKTLYTKLGDCKDLATLFVSMAKEAGLNAGLVLVSTKGNDENEFQLPTINFNHCIAHLISDEKDYLIELTDNYLPFSAMGLPLLNAVGLVIPTNNEGEHKDSIELLNTPYRKPNINIRKAEMSFNNSKLLLHRDVIKVGSEASRFHFMFNEGDNDQKVKKLKADIDKEFNKDVKMEEVKFPILTNTKDSLQLDYSFSVENFTSEIAGMQVFKMPWTEAYSLAPVFSLEKRKYPLAIWIIAPVKSSETITVTLPKGKQFVEKPKDVTVGCGALTYTLKYEVKGEKIIVTRLLTYLKDQIMPDEYEDVKNAITKISEADSKQFAFK